MSGAAPRRSRLLGWACAAALAALAPATSWAADPKPPGQRAEEAYDLGVTAHKRGDYASAAVLFALADELVPNTVALAAALESARLAGNGPLAMELAERADRAAEDAALAAAADQARRRFAGEVAAVRALCADCKVTVDGTPIPAGRALWLAPGDHVVETEEPSGRRTIRLAPGQVMQLAVDEPRADAPPSIPAHDASAPESPRPSGGVSPAWFWGGVGVTAILGVSTIASGVDVLSQHAEFERDRTKQRAADGEAAQTRTYVLAGVTAAAAIGTAALGLFAVRWSSRASASATPGGVRLSLVY